MSSGLSSRLALLAATAVSVAFLALVVSGGVLDSLGATWGVSGTAGTFVVDGCADKGAGRGGGVSYCVGTFTPDDGGRPHEVEVKLEAREGERFRVRAHGDEADRTDFASKLAVLAVPLVPVVVLATVLLVIVVFVREEPLRVWPIVAGLWAVLVVLTGIALFFTLFVR